MSNNNTEEDCDTGICEATEGFVAFCEALTDDGKRKRCIDIMDLLKDGKMEFDTAREKLTEELGKEAYMEGAMGLRKWIRGKEEPKTELESIEEVELSPAPVEPIVVEIPPVEPIITEKEIEELDEVISESELEPPLLPEVEKGPEEPSEPVETPSDASEKPQTEHSQE